MILASPEFLFRFEPDPAESGADTPYRIDDLALASRLSFFLWSSIPDDSSLNLASQGKLKDPAVLDQQIKRMLADPRAEALVDNFRRTVAVPAQSQDTRPGPGGVSRISTTICARP